MHRQQATTPQQNNIMEEPIHEPIPTSEEPYFGACPNRERDKAERELVAEKFRRADRATILSENTPAAIIALSNYRRVKHHFQCEPWQILPAADEAKIIKYSAPILQRFAQLGPFVQQYGLHLVTALVLEKNAERVARIVANKEKARRQPQNEWAKNTPTTVEITPKDFDQAIAALKKQQHQVRHAHPNISQCCDEEMTITFTAAATRPRRGTSVANAFVQAGIRSSKRPGQSNPETPRSKRQRSRDESPEIELPRTEAARQDLDSPGGPVSTQSNTPFMQDDPVLPDYGNDHEDDATLNEIGLIVDEDGPIIDDDASALEECTHHGRIMDKVAPIVDKDAPITGEDALITENEAPIMDDEAFDDDDELTIEESPSRRLSGKGVSRHVLPTELHIQSVPRTPSSRSQNGTTSGTRGQTSRKATVPPSRQRTTNNRQLQANGDLHDDEASGDDDEDEDDSMRDKGPTDQDEDMTISVDSICTGYRAEVNRIRRDIRTLVTDVQSPEDFDDPIMLPRQQMLQMAIVILNEFPRHRTRIANVKALTHTLLSRVRNIEQDVAKRASTAREQKRIGEEKLQAVLQSPLAQAGGDQQALEQLLQFSVDPQKAKELIMYHVEGFQKKINELVIEIKQLETCQKEVESDKVHVGEVIEQIRKITKYVDDAVKSAAKDKEYFEKNRWDAHEM
jgi:hypothetical protein